MSGVFRHFAMSLSDALTIMLRVSDEEKFSSLQIFISRKILQSLENEGDFFFTMTQEPSSGPWPPHYRGFVITHRHATLCRTPLDK